MLVRDGDAWRAIHESPLRYGWAHRFALLGMKKRTSVRFPAVQLCALHIRFQSVSPKAGNSFIASIGAPVPECVDDHKASLLSLL